MSGYFGRSLTSAVGLTFAGEYLYRGYALLRSPCMRYNSLEQRRTQSLAHSKSIVEHSHGLIATALRNFWLFITSPGALSSLRESHLEPDQINICPGTAISLPRIAVRNVLDACNVLISSAFRCYSKELRLEKVTDLCATHDNPFIFASSPRFATSKVRPHVESIHSPSTYALVLKRGVLRGFNYRSGCPFCRPKQLSVDITQGNVHSPKEDEDVSSPTPRSNLYPSSHSNRQTSELGLTLRLSGSHCVLKLATLHYSRKNSKKSPISNLWWMMSRDRSSFQST